MKMELHKQETEIPNIKLDQDEVNKMKSVFSKEIIKEFMKDYNCTEDSARTSLAEQYVFNKALENLNNIQE
jgi:Glu-tRNA(Gln) amidotransferase subunit E-like FAD-binding protein